MSTQAHTPSPTIAKLLRAIANGSDARAKRHDIIFNAAADALDLQADLLKELKAARECIAYCRRAHKDPQSGEGIPIEMFIDAAIAKAEGRS